MLQGFNSAQSPTRGHQRRSALLRRHQHDITHSPNAITPPHRHYRSPLPEFFWLVTGLPSAGTACWKTCTVSCTTCRCKHTSSGSLHVATFWASRNRGSARSRRLKAAAFSVLSPGGRGAAVTTGPPDIDPPPVTPSLSTRYPGNARPPPPPITQVTVCPPHSR